MKVKLSQYYVKVQVKKDDTVLAGYTAKNKLVNFKAPKEMIGKLVDVKIDEAKQYSLNGTFVGEHQK